MRDDKTGTDEELNTPDTARTIPTRRRKEPEPPATDEWRPPASLNPWGARVRRRQPAGRTVHGKQQKTETTLQHAPVPESGIGRHGGRQATPHWKACGEPNGRNSHNDRRKHQPAGRRTLPFRRLGRTLRWAREHSTPQQIARHLLDPQWRNRDYNALDELVEMTHDADLSSLSRTIWKHSRPADCRNSDRRSSAMPARRHVCSRTWPAPKATRDCCRCSSNQANSARTPSTCAAGTRRTADWRQACCRKPRTTCSTVSADATGGHPGRTPSNPADSTARTWTT